jgi:hypothetical protein
MIWLHANTLGPAPVSDCLSFSVSLCVATMGRRPLPAVRDLTRDGRWSTYDVSVLKKMGGKMRTDRTPSKATITNQSRPAGSFSSS